eukprot:PhF_6_TR41007/c0_g1_i1/m.62116
MASFLANIRATIFVLFLDIFLHSIRPSWHYGTTIAQYVLVALHGVTGILGIGMIYIHLSKTIWFEGGLFGEIFRVVRVPVLFWFIHFALIFVSWAYRQFITKKHIPWDDTTYYAIVVVEQVFAVLYWSGVVYVMVRVSDKYLYPPYHRMRWAQRAALAHKTERELQLQQQQQQNV